MTDARKLGVDRYIEWLQMLPEGSQVVWTSPHVSEKEPYAHGWVDVSVPEFEDYDKGMSWTVTIVHPDDPDLTSDGYEGLCWALPSDRPMDGGWTTEAITRCLSEWAAENADRPDLYFVWDPHFVDRFSEMLASRMEEMRSGAVEPILFNQVDGATIHIHPDAFDTLLALPEETQAVISSEITQAIISELKGN